MPGTACFGSGNRFGSRKAWGGGGFEPYGWTVWNTWQDALLYVTILMGLSSVQNTFIWRVFFIIFIFLLMLMQMVCIKLHTVSKTCSYLRISAVNLYNHISWSLSLSIIITSTVVVVVVVSDRVTGTKLPFVMLTEFPFCRIICPFAELLLWADWRFLTVSSSALVSTAVSYVIIMNLITIIITVKINFFIAYNPCIIICQVIYISFVIN